MLVTGIAADAPGAAAMAAAAAPVAIVVAM
jgi:hypothetical protein